MAQKFTVPITVKQLASAGSDAVTVYVDQDTFSRLKVEAGGRLTWGSGASAGDVNLYRDSADVLKTDDTFKTPALFVDNIEIDTTGATTTQALVFNGVKFVPGDVAASGGASLTVSDTAPASPEVGDLWFNSTNARTYVYYDSSWVEVGGSGGVATLDDIGDVTAPSPSNGDYLQWNGSTWTSASVASISSIDDIADVVVTSPLQFQGLMYDGTNWVNSNIPDVYLVRNNTGSTILKGTLVGAVGAEPSGRIDVAPFEVTGTENSELRAMGIAASNISNGVNGEVMSFGTLTGLDTRGSTASALAVGDETWAAGDILFAHPTVNGKLTNVRPQHDLAVAFITVRHASTGQIAIRIIPGNNHLEWMHDVSLVDKTSGDFLKYNGTLWVNDQINLGTDTVGNYVSSVTAGTGISVDFTPSEGAGASVSLNATLDDLSNVSVATPNTNDVLTYNGSAWTAASAGGGSTVTASTTPPSSPESGSIWFDSSTAKTYVYYDSFWVEIGGTSGGAKMYVDSTAPSTPLEGQLWFNSDTAQTFAYYDSSWVEIGAAGMAAIAADAAPASPVTGQIWFNTSTGATYVYYDSYWIEVGAVAANTVFNLIDAKGDLLLGTADNTLARQAVGTNGQLLQANSSATNGVEWITPAYAPTAGPTFTGTVVLPSTTSIGTVTSTEIGYVDGVTSAIQTQLDSKAPLAGPTFTGTVVLPSTTSIGTITSTELGYVDGVTSAIQTQLNAKAPTASPTFTGEVSGSGRITQTNASGNVWLGDWAGGSAYRGVGTANTFLLLGHATDTNSYLINNTGGISLRTAGLDRINASSTGWVTTPYNPSFSAYNVNAASGGQDLVFATTAVNAGSCYNTSNGRFTAPIAGSYWFAYNCLQQNGNTGEYRHALYKNGGGYGGLRFIFFKDAAGWQSTYAYGVIYMAANDYVTLRYESGAGVMYTDGNYSNFSGYLIG